MEGRSLQRRVSVSRSSNFRDHLKIRDEDEDDNDKETSGAVTHNEEPAAPAVEEEKPQQVSLMALLEQTDRQWAGGGETAAEEPEAEEEEEEEVEEEKRGKKRGMYSVCCVCMVRHKGAAFIPCGHTFCRLCSRELWVSRGNCPLCNGFILEILDIF